jgi:NADH-quinone oxidoreductase subunit J
MALLVAAFRRTVFDAPKGVFTAEKMEQVGGNTQAISHVMFSDYILPFELTSVLLLTGIVGAVAIAKRNQPKRKGGRR